jgi:hypothetical protein
MKELHSQKRIRRDPVRSYSRKVRSSQHNDTPEFRRTSTEYPNIVNFKQERSSLLINQLVFDDTGSSDADSLRFGVVSDVLLKSALCSEIILHCHMRHADLIVDRHFHRVQRLFPISNRPPKLHLTLFRLEAEITLPIFDWYGFPIPQGGAIWAFEKDVHATCRGSGRDRYIQSRVQSLGDVYLNAEIVDPVLVNFEMDGSPWTDGHEDWTPIPSIAEIEGG